MFIPRPVKIQEIIAAVCAPFSFAAAFLLAFLALVEFLRHGAVALFFDVRWLYVAAVILLFGDVVAGEKKGNGALSLAAAGALFLTGVFWTWKLAAPYGRLGLAVFVCGSIGLVLAFFVAGKSANKVD
jgi:hypothetical protein